MGMRSDWLLTILELGRDWAQLLKNHRDWTQSRSQNPRFPCSCWGGGGTEGNGGFCPPPPQDRGIAGSGNEIGLHNELYRKKAES